MMAKMFYTMDETKAALGKSEEDIKQLSREGRLREFRDGPRLMFKADQVEALKTEMGGGGPISDQVDLGPSDSGGPIGLIDSRGASGSGITLSDSDAGRAAKDDTALAADPGLSGLGGSVGGVPSPRPGGSSASLSGIDLGGTGMSGSGLSGLGMSLSGTGTGAGKGINVLGSDEIDRPADPMAQTAVSGGLSDQVNLESIGSGSGLLDLTRESDDTSLGADLLDEISPGKKKADTAAGTRVSEAVAAGVADEARGGVRTIHAPIVEAVDPLAPAFGGMAAGAVIALLIGVVAVTAGALGNSNEIVQTLAGFGFLVLAAILAAPVAIFAVFGLIVGKMVSR